MIYPVWQQFLILAAAMIGGFLIAVFFDVAEAIRLLLHLPKKRLFYIPLWLLCAAGFFAVWLELFAGAFRLFYFFWMAAGFILYFFRLGNPLRKAARVKAKETSPIICAAKIISRGESYAFDKFCTAAKTTKKCFVWMKNKTAHLAMLIPKKRNNSEK